ncbi:hypothetical protein BDF21DRAFT_424799 [Thamnidium elegans]|uniref:Uncharacterized protein n=1 Tax=Thamnidium elegans TaxID=101142 RepID=A0A8H7SW67_9FUNG|nr:hypothetical protein INT48_005523 [Thamnidium elegans]KAI8072055.1 hypothetical protein BDF21DRAFT_424799 [Thamnidium elegans]
MPRTPPIILPTSPSGSWFSSTAAKEKDVTYDKLEDLDNLSPFTYSPSDDDESLNTNKRPKKTCNDLPEQPLYHKPTSNQPSQQSTGRSNQQQYELIDEDEDDQNSDNNSNQDNTQCEEDKFNSVIDDLKSEFKLYTDEYKEFKRHVDNAKRELLEFIQDRTLYFEERGTYLNQKWDSLRQLI